MNPDDYIWLGPTHPCCAHVPLYDPAPLYKASLDRLRQILNRR